MKIYNLPLSLECIEIIYFKKFKLPKKLKLLNSCEFYNSILESINNDMFYLYKIGDTYYSASEIDIDENQKHEAELFIINIPNIYIQDNTVSFMVNILDLVYFEIIKNIQYNYKDIYLFFNDVDLTHLENDNLKIKIISDISNSYDNSNYDIIVNNKKTSFIGLNPNTQFILNNNNITMNYVSKIFNILKILCIVEKFYDFSNIYIVNNTDESYENTCTINNIYSKNIKNVRMKDIMDIFQFLKKTDSIFYI